MSSLPRLPEHEIKASSMKKMISLDSIEESDSNTNCSDEDGVGYAKHLESFYIHKDGKVVVASSNLHGPKCDGFITKYASISDVPVRPSLSLNPRLGGCSNLLATRHNRYLCSFDSGSILILNQDLEQQSSATLHHDIVTYV
jgi:hypothetical protein